MLLNCFLFCFAKLSLLNRVGKCKMGTMAIATLIGRPIFFLDVYQMSAHTTLKMFDLRL